jgi:flagellar basal body-associated protein FliL
VILILIFFILFGCSYEFVKCYLNRKTGEENEDEQNEDENDSVEIRNRYQQEHNNNNEDQEEGKEKRKNSKGIIILLAVLGFLCQPFYLIFYFLYGLMECYRRFSCWFYYVDY